MPNVFELEPSSVQEAAYELAQASRKGLNVSIDRDGGDLVLSTAGLNRILEHEAGDLTVTVESGVRLTELNERLAAHGQRLSLDPPGEPTIGAVVAGDSFGPLGYRYGRARDLILGVTVVLSDGTVANAGGKVVKNVAGYDLGKVFCGSAGRLGLIVRASFRLHPVPETARTLVVEAGEPEQAQRVARSLLHSELVPSAVDLLWPGRMAILFEGSAGAAAEQLERGGELFGGREDASVWDEARERQRAAAGRRAFGAAELAGVLTDLGEGLVRLGPTCFAFGDVERAPWSPLAERVRVELDPDGVLA